MEAHASSIQRQKILAYLQKHGSATTLELRHNLDVIAPAPRIFELRHDYNHNIVTAWSTDSNPGGTEHRVAKYTLKPGKYKEGKL